MLSNLLSNKIHLSRFYFIINIASKFLMIEFIVWLLLLALSEAIWDAQKWLYSLRFDLRVWELSKTGLDFAVDAWNCVDWFWPSFMCRFSEPCLALRSSWVRKATCGFVPLLLGVHHVLTAWPILGLHLMWLKNVIFMFVLLMRLQVITHLIEMKITKYIISF